MTKKAKKTLVALLVIFVTLHVNTIFANESNECAAENAEKLKNTNKTSSSSRPFISTWQTTSDNEEIRVPIGTTLIISIL